MTYGVPRERDDRSGETYPPYRPAGAPRGAAGGGGASGDWGAGRVERARDDDAARRRSKRHKGMPLWQELPLLLFVAFCLAVLIRTFLLQAFFIPSGSMEDTLLVGDRVLVNKVVYDVRDPERGEIVVFRGPDTWAAENLADDNIGFFASLGRTMGDLVGISRPGEKDFIKRVVGLPGDTVACCDVDGRVFVNGQPLDETYVIRNSPLDVPPDARQCRSRAFAPVTVEPGQIFVLGDHRSVSQDSRCQGTVPIDNVIGRAFIIVWPSARWDNLSVPETFTDVPRPFAAGPGPAVREPSGTGGILVTVPILLPLLVSARSRRVLPARPRRLAE